MADCKNVQFHLIFIVELDVLELSPALGDLYYCFTDYYAWLCPNKASVS